MNPRDIAGEHRRRRRRRTYKYVKAQIHHQHIAPIWVCCICTQMAALYQNLTVENSNTSNTLLTIIMQVLLSVKQTRDESLWTGCCGMLLSMCVNCWGKIRHWMMVESADQLTSWWLASTATVLTLPMERQHQLHNLSMFCIQAFIWCGNYPVCVTYCWSFYKRIYDPNTKNACTELLQSYLEGSVDLS